MLDNVHDVDIYMEVVTKHGITWADFYRDLGVLALLTIVAATIGVPAISLVDPVLWASAFLISFAASTAYQLRYRGSMFIRQLLR
jgi:hypothetical protein